MSKRSYHKKSARHRKPEPAEHRADPLHEPRGPTGLLEDGRWHAPPAPRYDSQGFRTDLYPAPVPETQEFPQPARPALPQPKRKINSRNITAAAFTLIIAVPALFMAGWIARQGKAADPPQVMQVSYLPLTLYSGKSRKPEKICLVIDNRESAWATSAPCLAAPARAGQTQPSPG
jgi:hypothetical protein